MTDKQTAEFKVDVTPKMSSNDVLAEGEIEKLEGSVVPLTLEFGTKIGTAELHVEGDKVIAYCKVKGVDELSYIRASLLGNAPITDVCEFGLSGIADSHRDENGVCVITSFRAYEVSVGPRLVKKEEKVF